MADDILYRCLRGDIKIEDLCTWILHKKCSAAFGSSSPGEFISLFLNFIHESIISPNFASNALQKIECTPKSIRPPIRDSTMKPRRRPALFSDESKCTTSQSDKSVMLKDVDNVMRTNSCLDKNDRLMTSPALISQAQNEVCPISPLHSVNTPIRWRNQPLKQSTPFQSKGLRLGDFMSNSLSARKSSTKKRGLKRFEANQDQQRRINPVIPYTESSSGSNGNSFNFQNMHSNEIINTPPQCNISSATLSKSNENTPSNEIGIISSTPNRDSEIEPNLSSTTFIKHLDNCSAIYLLLLKNNLTLNILSEFYFLMTLVSRRYSKHRSQDNHGGNDFNSKNLKVIFNSIHNVTYFASKVLKEFVDFINVFDRATIKFLLDNNRVSTYVDISMELEIMFNAKASIPLHHPTVPLSTPNTVHFAADTDGRPNFTSDAAFNAFRRQRDTFYDLLRAWQQYHHNNNGNVMNDASAGGGGEFNMVARVRQLFDMNVDGDYRHLARLWRAQMLVDCCGGGSGIGQSTDHQSTPPSPASDYSHLIIALPHLHPDKLSLLRSRLTTRQQPTSSALLAGTFAAAQEFYRDFILAADCNAWCCHLRDALTSELMKVYRETCVECGQVKRCDGELGKDTSAAGSAMVVGRMEVLKVLAKFLGFLESLPYYNSNFLLLNKDNASRTLTTIDDNSLDDLRRNYQPTFDLLGCLEKAVKEKCLVLTVPWMVEYCAMLDAGVMRVMYYERLFKVFFQVYQDSKQDFNNKRNCLIILCLGWLFELPHYPSELYYTWYNSRTTDQVRNNENGHKNDTSKAAPVCIDELNIIDEAILYALFPQLGEFRRLLLSTHNCNNHVTVKHITPVAAVEERSQELTERKLKVQLEEAFFDAQPASVRKIVDFVSERVASTSVKIICNKIVPTYRKSSLESFKSFLREQDFDNTDAALLRISVEAEFKDFQARSLKYLQILCASEAKQIIQDRVYVTVELLLSDEELPQTKIICGDITTRISFEKVQHWITTHVNTGVLSKEFHAEVEKCIERYSGVPVVDADFKLAFQLPSEGRCTTHNDNTLSAINLVEEIRSLTLNTLEKSLSITVDCIDKIIKDACDTLTQRCDVNDCILFLINKLLLDLLILLVSHKSNLVTATLIQKFIEFWSNYCFVETSSSNVTKNTFNLANLQMISSLNPFGSTELQSSLLTMDISSNNVDSSNERIGSNIMKRLFNVIICPRNVVILSYGNSDSSFGVFALLIVELLRRDLISCKDIEEQVVALYKHEWSNVNLQRISTFILELADRCINLKTDHRFSLLLDFLRSFCALDF